MSKWNRREGQWWLTAVREICRGDDRRRRQHHDAAHQRGVRTATHRRHRLTRRRVERVEQVGRALRAMRRLLLETLRDQCGDRGRHVAPSVSDRTRYVLKV